MTYGMDTEESRGVIQFPRDGFKAVDVPLEKMVFSAGDGLLTAKAEGTDYNAKLSKDLDRSFQKIRSMVIYSHVPIRISGLYEDPVYLGAGRNVLQELPETEEFEIHYGFRYDSTDLEPGKAQTYIKAFNTARLPDIKNDEKEPASMSKEKTVDSTDWTSVISQPASPYDDKALRFENTGDNTLEYRIISHNAGKAQPEPLDNAGSRKKEIGSGDLKAFYMNNVSDYVELQAREKSSGNSSNIEATYSGAGY